MANNDVKIFGLFISFTLLVMWLTGWLIVQELLFPGRILYYILSYKRVYGQQPPNLRLYFLLTFPNIFLGTMVTDFLHSDPVIERMFFLHLFEYALITFLIDYIPKKLNLEQSVEKIQTNVHILRFIFLCEGLESSLDICRSVEIGLHYLPSMLYAMWWYSLSNIINCSDDHLKKRKEGSTNN